MKLLKELMDMSGNVTLMNNQKIVLIVCKTAATPEQAYETLIGDPSLIAARDLLLDMGYLHMETNRLELTELGEDALTSFNLVDDTGRLTDLGANLMSELDDYQQNAYQPV